MVKSKRFLTLVLILVSALLLFGTAFAAVKENNPPRISDVQVENVTKGTSSTAEDKVDINAVKGDQIHISCKVLDESAVQQVTVTLKAPLGMNGDITAPSERAYKRILELDYDEETNRWEIDLTMNDKWYEGTYSVLCVDAVDEFNNTATLWNVGVGKIIFTNPMVCEFYVDSFTLDEDTMDVTAGDTIHAKVGLIFDNKGMDIDVAEVVVEISSESSGIVFDSFELDDQGALIYGGTYCIPDSMKAGRYDLKAYAYLDNGGRAGLSGRYIDVVKTAADKEAPVFDEDSVYFTEAGQQLVIGDTLNFGVKVSDESEIDSVWAQFFNADNGGFYYYLTKDARDGYYKMSTMISDNFISGKWSLQGFGARDEYGNSTWFDVNASFYVVDQIILTEEIDLSETSKEINLASGTSFSDYDFDLTYTVAPTDVSMTDVKWVSSNEDVATVWDGHVYIQGYGSTKISVVALDGSGVSASCRVTVTYKMVDRIILKHKDENNKWAAITNWDVELNRTNYKTEITKTLKAFVEPDDAFDPSVEWSSSDEDVAVVSAKGVVTIKGVGEAQIICSTKDDSGKKAVVTVKVTTQKATGIKLAKAKVLLIRTKDDPKPSYRMKATVKPSTVINKQLVWSSSNPKVATVNKNGVITGLKKGVVTITVKLANSKVSASFKVLVK